MSFATMNRRQGTRVTVYRGTKLGRDDGDRYFGAPWTVVAAAVDCTIQDSPSVTLLKAFGESAMGRGTGFLAPDLIADQDRIIATAGPFAGSRYVASQLVRHRAGSRHDHDEFSVETTTEVFP